MAFEVLRTPQVRDAVAQMSRTERASYEAARDELGGRGCIAGGYKLATTDGGDYPVCATPDEPRATQAARQHPLSRPRPEASDSGRHPARSNGCGPHRQAPGDAAHKKTPT
jgi:hypothetical protein